MRCALGGLRACRTLQALCASAQPVCAYAQSHAIGVEDGLPAKPVCDGWEIAVTPEQAE